MNPILLGSLTALCWGTVDFIAGRTSATAGAIRTTAGVTIAGLILLTAWLAASGTFPSLSQGPIWLPLVAGAGFALATMCLFAAISSEPSIAQVRSCRPMRISTGCVISPRRSSTSMLPYSWAAKACLPRPTRSMGTGGVSLDGSVGGGAAAGGRGASAGIG